MVNARHVFIIKYLDAICYSSQSRVTLINRNNAYCLSTESVFHKKAHANSIDHFRTVSSETVLFMFFAKAEKVK